jgi:hypothetical protein
MLVNCPSCHRAFRGPDGAEGRPASCPSCGARFICEASPEPPPIVSPYVAPRRPRQRKQNNNLVVSLLIAGALLAMGVAIYGFATLPTTPSDSHRAAAGSSSGQDWVMAALVIVVLVACAIGSLAAYVVPSIIAFHRGHQNAAAILALNLLLGWTFVFWVAALVWSLTEVRTRENYHYHLGPHSPPNS